MGIADGAGSRERYQYLLLSTNCLPHAAATSAERDPADRWCCQHGVLCGAGHSSGRCTFAGNLSRVPDVTTSNRRGFRLGYRPDIVIIACSSVRSSDVDLFGPLSDPNKEKDFCIPEGV